MAEEVRRRASQCDLELVAEWFGRCIKDDGDVLLDPYLSAYDELRRYVSIH